MFALLNVADWSNTGLSDDSYEAGYPTARSKEKETQLNKEMLIVVSPW